MSLPPISFESTWRWIVALAAMLSREAAALPRVAAIALTVVGLVVAVLGSRKPMVRVVALAAGAGLGAALAPVLSPFLGFPGDKLVYALGAALGILGALLPASVVFLVLGGVVGLLGASFFPPTDRLVAFLPGFLLGGIVGAIFFPWIAAGLTGLAGGTAFAIGLSGALPKAAGGAWLIAHPFGILGLGLALAVSGTIGQLNLPDEEGQATDDAVRARKKQIRNSEKARDARFAKYDQKAKKASRR
jgi:hypothetical protein